MRNKATPIKLYHRRWGHIQMRSQCGYLKIQLRLEIILNLRSFSVVNLRSFNMPLSKKILLNARKRDTASTRARILVKKTRKVSSQLDGSYLENSKIKIASEMPVPHSLGKYF